MGQAKIEQAIALTYYPYLAYKNSAGLPPGARDFFAETEWKRPEQTFARGWKVCQCQLWRALMQLNEKKLQFREVGEELNVTVKHGEPPLYNGVASN